MSVTPLIMQGWDWHAHTGVQILDASSDEGADNHSNDSAPKSKGTAQVGMPNV